MPQSKCVVPDCDNNADHYFPKDDSNRNVWINAARLDEKFKMGCTLKKYSLICLAHFLPSDYINHGRRLFLKKTAVPSIFSWSENLSSQSSNLPVVSRKRQQTATALTPKKIVKTYSRSELPTAYVEVLPSYDIDSGTMEPDPLHIFDENIPTLVEETTQANEIQSSEEILTYQLVEEIVENSGIKSPAEVECHLTDSSVQTDSVIITSCNIAVQTQATEKPVFSVHDFKNSNQSIHFFTGLESFEKFKYVFSTLGDSSNLKYFYGFKSFVSMDPLEQFFLTLILLRRHKEHEEAAILFQISCKQVANIFITWVRFMSLQWKNLDLWIDRDKVTSSMPLDFHDKYPNTRVIIDATECPIRKPSLPMAQQVTFSSYKNRNTIKFLLGISPSGLITYVSPCYGGSTTDRQIIEESSILQKFEPNDEIMVDKGINVQDIFMPYQVKVNMPSFFRKVNQISPESLNRDQKVGSKRVHVERIIGMLKTYKILKEPMNQTETILSSDIVFICAMLVNFRSNIINKTA